MNYYTTDNKNKIIEVSIFGCEPHWLNCNQTEEEIVRCEGQLMLKSEFEALSQTPEYIAEQRLKQIDIELQQAEQDYITAIDTPVSYTNGKEYKPKWAEQTYINLLTAGSIMPSMYPLLVWDATELEENALYFTQPELVALTTFLAFKQQQLFNTKKSIINQLLIEKDEILNPPKYII